MIQRSLIAGAIGMCLAFLSIPRNVAAQFRESPPPPAYALQSVTVVHADGRQEADVSIVVRNGVIEAMGPAIEIPGDALLLDGDSLFVYSGIVDANGQAEVAFPDIEREDSVRSWDAPRDVQGLLAHRRVVDYLDQGGAGGKEQRSKGVVASGILPDGALLAGLAAAIVHRTDVDRPWQLVVNNNVGLVMAFQAGQGVYPGTLFGIIAYMRQAFEDARRDLSIRQAHDENPNGLSLPAFDPDYEILREAMAGVFPVLFSANRAEDIRRVLKLADEYGFRPIIVGGHQAWRVADELARKNIPVILDGDFPKPNEWKPDDADSTSADSTNSESVNKPLEPGAAREKQRIEDVRANAGRLAAAGVRFAISSGGGDGDILDAARVSIEYGLPADIALQSITTVPAEMLGIPSVTRIGQGMTATFIAMSGPIFSENTEIAHIFVEGGYEEGSGGGGGGEAPTVNVTGDWTLTLTGGGMEFELETNLNMDADGTFSGSASSDQFGSAPVRGRVTGNKMEFTITISAGGQEIELTGEGTVEGDGVSGTGESPFGPFTLSGTKNPGGAK